MTRPRIVIGNWKLNPSTLAEALDLARSVARIDAAPVDVGVAAPAIVLAAVAQALGQSPVRVYAQDVHWEEKGAFTGGTPVGMLRGTAYGTLIGHSEMRLHGADDDERVAKKVARALAAGLRVVLCVGESEAQYDAKRTQSVIAKQIAADLAAAPRGSSLVVAYEPVWAIGTGRPATAAHAAEAAATIRAALARAGSDAEMTPVLYGGSVTAAGVAEFASAEGIDGALVGGASLKPEDFAAIVRAFR